MNDTLPAGSGSIAAGLLLTVGLHGAAVGVSCLAATLGGTAASNGLMPFIGIGVVQVLYLLPAYLVCLSKGRRRTRQGIALGAGITFLLNATCFGLVAANGF